MPIRDIQGELKPSCADLADTYYLHVYLLRNIASEIVNLIDILNIKRDIKLKSRASAIILLTNGGNNIICFTKPAGKSGVKGILRTGR